MKNDTLVINYDHKISNEILISGSKNAALPILISTILARNTITLNNIPNISDIKSILDIFDDIGIRYLKSHNSITVFATKNSNRYIIKKHNINKTRASSLFMGALLAKNGVCIIDNNIGGCSIGSSGKRPIDIHLDIFKQIGIKYSFIGNKIKLNIKTKINDIKKSHNKIIVKLKAISVGATQNIIMAATIFNNSIITIKNIAIEPEIQDFILFMNKIGYNVKLDCKNKIIILNNQKASLERYQHQIVKHNIIPDRIEFASYLMLSLSTQKNMVIKNIIIQHNTYLIKFFKENFNINISILNNQLDTQTIITQLHNSHIRKNEISIFAEPFPGIPTDIQPILAVFLCSLKYIKAKIIDNIYPERHAYVKELQKLQYNIHIKENAIFIDHNNSNIHKNIKHDLEVSDLRAGFALIIAAMIVSKKYKTKISINKMSHVFRGYSNLLKNIEHVV